MSYTGHSYSSKVSSSNASGFTRNIGSAAMKVGQGIGTAARLAAGSAKAFGKSVVGQDDFTQQVARQAKGK